MEPPHGEDCDQSVNHRSSCTEGAADVNSFPAFQTSGGSRISGKGAGVARCRRPRGGRVWGGGVHYPFGWGLGRGCAPPQNNFEIQLLILGILVYSE